MNLLPHKSWNPWSAKNIEKVRKDEAEARNAEEAIREKAANAEREARFESLYQKKSTPKADEAVTELQTTPTLKHVNLFEDIEKQIVWIISRLDFNAFPGNGMEFFKRWKMDRRLRCHSCSEERKVSTRSGAEAFGQSCSR